MARDSVARLHRDCTGQSRRLRSPQRTSVGLAVVLGAVMASVLTGCGSSPQTDSGHTPDDPVSVPRHAKTPSPDSSVTGPHDRESTHKDLQDDAVEIALQAMGRFCRPQLSPADWISGLDPLLTLEAASAYATVNPARVRCTRTAPPARLLEGDGFTQVVAVPTDGSAYRVTLTRSSLSDPWLVSRITPAGRT